MRLYHVSMDEQIVDPSTLGPAESGEYRVQGRAPIRSDYEAPLPFSGVCTDLKAGREIQAEAEITRSRSATPGS